MRALRNAACEAADRGWKVLPLHPRAKAPLGRLVPRGYLDASSDLATVFGWWRTEPAANIGIACGPSGLIALDVDPRNGGDDSLAKGERALGRLPETVCAETGGGGSHFLFVHPGVPLKPVLAPGLDVKDDGYILIEPSVHPSGRAYAWDLGPDDVAPASLPAVWLSRMKAPPRTERRDVKLNAEDPLLRIPADAYVPLLSGREVLRDGWVRCPFHGGGREQGPSLKIDGALWACHGGCAPPAGKRVQGGTIYDFAAAKADLLVPLDAPDYHRLRERLRRFFATRGYDV